MEADLGEYHWKELKCQNSPHWPRFQASSSPVKSSLSKACQEKKVCRVDQSEAE